LATDRRTWRVSLEIRSLRLTGSSANAFVAYLYAPFAQPRAFRTNPPTLVRKNQTINLPHAFAAYTLTATPEELRGQLAEPLRAEIWHRDIYRKDDLLGLVDVIFVDAFDRPLQYSQKMPSMVRGFRVLDQVCPVLGVAESTPTRIGALGLAFFLEDLGPAQGAAIPDVAAAPPPAVVQQQHAGRRGPAVHSRGAAVGGDGAVVDGGSVEDQRGMSEASLQDGLQALRGSPAYATAYELELWKRAEEAAFKVKLQDDERMRRNKLQEE
jgi:hypothetical protein